MKLDFISPFRLRASFRMSQRSMLNTRRYYRYLEVRAMVSSIRGHLTFMTAQKKIGRKCLSHQKSHRTKLTRSKMTPNAALNASTQLICKISFFMVTSLTVTTKDWTSSLQRATICTPLTARLSIRSVMSASIET